VTQQHPPVRPEPVQQAIPVQQSAAVAETGAPRRRHQPLPLHDERLGPDHLLGRAQPRRHAEDLLVDRVREPSSSTSATPFPELKIHVDEAVAR